MALSIFNFKEINMFIPLIKTIIGAKIHIENIGFISLE